MENTEVIIKLFLEKRQGVFIIAGTFIRINTVHQSGPEVIKLFSCSTQLSMKFFLLINVKMPTIVGILTFLSGKNSSLGIFEPEKKLNLISLYF